MKNKIGFLLFLVVSTTLAAADQVALLVSHRVYSELKPDIQKYKADVEARFPVRLQIVEGAWGKPAEVRSTIKSLHDKERITGVVLVGALPMHFFFMHEHPNPNPLYYEDFDLEFVDRWCGCIRDRRGKPNPEDSQIGILITLPESRSLGHGKWQRQALGKR